MPQPYQPVPSGQPGMPNQSMMMVPIQPVKKPFWKRWWFIAVVVIVLIGVFAPKGGGSSSSSKAAATSEAPAAASQIANPPASEPENPLETAAQEATAMGDQALKETGSSKSAAGLTLADDHTIVFEVTSDTATTADITITSLDANGNINQQQLAAESLPFSKTIQIDGSVLFDPTNANILAQANDGTDISASVKVDDKPAVVSTGAGMYATTMAQAS